MADGPADLLSAYYEILQAGAESYDRERLRSILAADLDFDGPIAGRVQGADRFTYGVTGFIATQQGIRFVQQVVTHDAAAVLYDADLPGGTLRFADFFRFDGGQIASIKLLYDPARYTALGGR
jgi:SnoaL-like protein